MSGPAGVVIGFVDGRPVPRTELDHRLAALRRGPRAGTLPAPGSAEDRQLTRWVAQVILTERLCAAEVAARGLPPTSSTQPVRLDRRAAVELGSITAAAFEGSAAVRSAYAAVTADVTVTAEQVHACRATTTPAPAGPRWRLSMDTGEFDAAPDTLPGPLAAALRAATPGQTVTAGGWTVTLLGETELDETPAADEKTSDALRGAAQRALFVRWLDHARAYRLRLVTGFEHPGDPRQPDNHHRH